MAAASVRETSVFLAKLAEQAERYDGMIEAMKKVALMDVDMTAEERNLFSVGYKNLVGSHRASWRILSSIEQKENTRGYVQNVKRIKEYLQKVESDIENLCNEILVILDEHVIPSCTTAEANVFYHKMKGDYYRYLAEFRTGDDKKKFADLSQTAYEEGAETARSELPPTHPIRLGLDLNFSVFFYEILCSPDRAYRHAKMAFEEALTAFSSSDEEASDDSTLVIQLLRDNLRVWTDEVKDERELL